MAFSSVCSENLSIYEQMDIVGEIFWIVCERIIWNKFGGTYLYKVFK